MNGTWEIGSFLDETYEYAFAPVPAEKRKPTGRLALILAGFAASLSGLSMGAYVGEALPFYQAAGACVAGTGILFFMALFWGLCGYRTGYTSAFVVRKALGERTAAVFSMMILLTMILWTGVNGELLARTTIAVFPAWPLPIPLTVLLAVALGLVCSLRGWRSLENVGRVVVPLIALVTVWNIIQVGQAREGFGFLLRYKPVRKITFTTAVTMIVGNFSISAATMPDLCRFARSRRAVGGCVSVYAGALLVSNLCGILVVQATGAHNLNYGLLCLEMAGQGFLWLTLCAYTTQNVNVYTGGLAIQNLTRGTVMGGNISNRTAALFVGASAIAVGVLGMARYIAAFSKLLVLAVIPLTGILMAETFAKTRADVDKERLALSAWLLGLAVGCVVWHFQLEKLDSLPMLSAGVFYALRRRKRGTRRRGGEAFPGSHIGASRWG